MKINGAPEKIKYFFGGKKNTSIVNKKLINMLNKQSKTMRLDK